MIRSCGQRKYSNDEYQAQPAGQGDSKVSSPVNQVASVPEVGPAIMTVEVFVRIREVSWEVVTVPVVKPSDVYDIVIIYSLDGMDSFGSEGLSVVSRLGVDEGLGLHAGAGGVM